MLVIIVNNLMLSNLTPVYCAWINIDGNRIWSSKWMYLQVSMKPHISGCNIRLYYQYFGITFRQSDVIIEVELARSRFLNTSVKWAETILWDNVFSVCYIIRVRFLCLVRSKLRLCSANNRADYFSNLARDLLSIFWTYSEQETENWPCRSD